MALIPVHVFKGSFRPIIELLNEKGIPYQMGGERSDVVMASSGVIEVVAHAVGSAAMWGGLASVLVAFIKAKAGRKVIINGSDGTVVHAEGLSTADVERLLERARSVTAIDPGKENSATEPPGR